MSNPITWRTVNAPNFSDALRAEQLAQASANLGFDNLRSTVRNLENINDQNWQTQKANNTDEFLNLARQKFNTPEAFAAAEASGALNEMYKQYGAQIDQAAARNFMTNQLGVLQNRAKTAIDYNNAVRTEQEAPIKDQFLAAVYGNDEAKQAEIMAANPNIRWGELRKADKDQERALVLQAQQDAKAQRDADLFPLEKDRIAAQIKAANANAAESYARANSNAFATKLALAEAKAREAAAEKAKKDGTADFNEFMSKGEYSMGTLDTKEGKAVFEAQLKERLKSGAIDQGDYEDIIYQYGKYWSKGLPLGKDSNGKTVYGPAPVKTVLDAIDNSSDNWFTFGSRKGDTADNILKDKLGDDSFTLYSGYNEDADLRNELIQGTKMIQDRMARLDPLGTKKAAANSETERERLIQEYLKKQQIKANRDFNRVNKDEINLLNRALSNRN